MILEDKVFWITGASSGIGEALAHQLAEIGCRLIVSARRENKLSEFQKTWGSNQVKILPLDLGEVALLREKAKIAESFFGRVDVMCLNGGVSQRSMVKESDMEVDRRVMEVNFFANVALTKAVLPGMLNRGAGHFLVTSSLTGKFGFKLRSAYASSKHALHGFFESLRFEEAPNGIGVTMICPGFIKTDLSKSAIQGDGTLHGAMDNNQAGGMLPEVCAKKMLVALRKEKHEVVIGNFEKNAVWIKRFFPGLHYRLVSKKDAKG